ncbi:uncharacterized protein BDW43DRAFT_282442 [Aspergillus alliaceus]|uniref:uncharacterized protein n=1 Tax=Petromyces alliaceus TaxID=209559 RepID=UPI0012A53686|nr:uncharacterized protein BDW43DRAFT_282442 [Aspergillus alliaceus]KAB8231495.1 hypothetical protein BDW43DRAFT_282442 [Aspergillus alliaceus]
MSRGALVYVETIAYRMSPGTPPTTPRFVQCTTTKALSFCLTLTFCSVSKHESGVETYIVLPLLFSFFFFILRFFFSSLLKPESCYPILFSALTNARDLVVVINAVLDQSSIAAAQCDNNEL